MPRRLPRVLVVALGALLGAASHAGDRIPPAPARVDVVQPAMTAPAPLGAPVRIPPAAHEIPLTGGRRHLIVQATINSVVSGPMLVDTGSSYCVLTRTTAHRLGLRGGGGRSIPVATANGQVAASLVQLDSMQLESARLGGVDTLIMDAVEPPLIGIIGLSFLNNFRYSVDSAQGTLRLER